MARRNWPASAGLIFVAAWVVGLLVQFEGPASTASAAETLAFFRDHQQGQMIQAFLIHGIAGLSLLVFAAALKGVFLRDGNRHIMWINIVFAAGIAAGTISLVQAAIGQVLANESILAQGDAAVVHVLSVFVNTVDTYKLLALALFALAASLLAFYTGALPRWLGWLGGVLALTLILGGLSFILENATLSVVLYAALPFLLIWAGVISVAILRIRD